MPARALGWREESRLRPMNDTYAAPAPAAEAIARDRSRELLGQVMGYVAVTLGFTALGAYLGRDLSGGAGLLFFIGAFAWLFGLNFASRRGREPLRPPRRLQERPRAARDRVAVRTRPAARSRGRAGDRRLRQRRPRRPL